jgi:hypothetical protein
MGFDKSDPGRFFCQVPGNGSADDTTANDNNERESGFHFIFFLVHLPFIGTNPITLI